QAYTGTLHVYAIDWETSVRRQNVTVSDGTTTRTVNVTNNVHDGAWMHFPVSVGAGGSVTVTADRTGTGSAVVGGLFLGGSGTAPPAPPPPPPPDESWRTGARARGL